MSEKSNKPVLKKQLISYTGVVLDQPSRELLKKKFNYYISSLTPVADHMTIVVGELKPHERDILGTEVELRVTELGEDEGVIAAGVETDIVVYDKKPHITLAIGYGVRPSASNTIENWRPIRHPFTVRGVIKEVPAGLTEDDENNRRGVLEPEDMDPALKQYGYSPLFPVANQQGASALMEGTEQSNNILQAINILPFKQDVYAAGGEIYAVGGVVRDAIINKPSSDLDIVIRGIPSEQLLTILKKYGWADINGTNFGTINFKSDDKSINQELINLGFEDVLDIALPRTDKAGDGQGHTDIVADVDHRLPIEKDLERRDFTVNSLAMSASGELIDPFGGVQDLKNGIIKWTNKEAFLDDPLRTIRAIRFAAVYGFELDDETKEAISTHIKSILNLPKERLLKEFKKMESKGGGQIYQRAYKLMVETNAFKIIFGFSPSATDIPVVEKLGDFIYTMVRMANDRPELIYKHALKGDTDTAKYIKALNFTETEPKSVGEGRELAANMYAIHADSLNSPLLTGELRSGADDLLSGKYPKNLRDLAVSGNDLMPLGIKGKELGGTLLKLFKLVLNDEVANEKQALLNTLNQSNDSQQEPVRTTVTELREGLEQQDQPVGVKHLIVLDMDKTMLITPEPEDGKKIWLEKTDTYYPHVGWWSRAESLDPEVFGDVIKPRADIKKIYDKYVNDPRVMVLLLTNRANKDDIVKNALHHLDKYYSNITVIPEISFKSNKKSKIERIMDILKKHPTMESVHFYDDQPHNFEGAEQLENYNVRYELHTVR